jgi:hypothetical protein
MNYLFPILLVSEDLEDLEKIDTLFIIIMKLVVVLLKLILMG